MSKLNKIICFVTALMCTACLNRENSQKMLTAKKVFSPKPVKEEVYAVIAGKTGAGKTSLLNKICGTKKPIGSAKGSLTRQLFCLPAIYGDHPFCLVDTPGMDSQEERYKHAFLLYTALTCVEYNAIILLIPYDSRFFRMIETYEELVKPMQQYRDNIIIMVSKFGEVDEEEDHDFMLEKKQIINEFESNKIFNNIIFYSKKKGCSEKDLSNMLYGILTNMPKVSIKIEKTDFYKDYGAFLSTEKICMKKKIYEGEMEKIYNNFLQLSKDTSSSVDPEKDTILQFFIIDIENKLINFSANQIEEIQDSLDEFDLLNLQVYLHGESLRYTTMFRNKISGLFSWNIMDRGDVRNWIKKCPNCGEVWMVVEGCDGETDCGNVVKNKGMLSNKDQTANNNWWFKYDIIWQGGKLVFKKLEQVKKAEEHKKFIYEALDDEKIEKKNEGPKVTIKRRGCGQVFTTRNLPPLSESELLKLFEVENIDVLKDYLKDSNKKYLKLASKYESSIDSDFHK